MTDQETHDEHGHGGTTKYVCVFGALCALTLTSFLAAQADFIMATPQVGWTVMMAVSCMKALLVMGFFMHLLWEANWKYVLTIPATIMSILLILMLVPDIYHRTDHYAEERLLHAPALETAHHGEEAGDSGEHNGVAHD
ncbi:MAG: cytochrome C oxidase subunit IV family protein [Pirellulaceae bacterium]|jgi:cytochrome c oxidase subunit 4|nr:cytochrome C oxidase subunit IV family protein [Pirellulaceae bacterium]MDP7018794.1 cytochrome C oxidase subunit IV family protein [Pirellulaceae bacterium]